MMRLSSLTSPADDATHHAFQGKGARQVLLLLALHHVLLHKGPGGLRVGHHHEPVSGLGHGAEALNFHGHRRARLLDSPSKVVLHGPYAAPGSPRNNAVANLQGAALYQQGGHGPPVSIQLGLDDHAGGGASGVCFQFGYLRHHQNALQQVVDARPVLGGNGNADNLSAKVLQHKGVLQQLALDPVGTGVGQVNLVDSDDDGKFGGPGVVDGFHGLGHDAVVSRHHQDGDVRDLGAPRSNGGESLVTGGVQEGNLLAVVLDLVGADVLGDAAHFTLGDAAVADGVEKGGLAVVHVAKDGHHGAAGLHGGIVTGVGGLKNVAHGSPGPLLGLGAVAEGGGNGGRQVEVDYLVNGSHDAVAHKLLDNVDGADPHQVSQVLDGKSRGKLDFPGTGSSRSRSSGCHGASFPATIPCHCVYSAHRCFLAWVGTGDRKARSSNPLSHTCCQHSRLWQR